MSEIKRILTALIAAVTLFVILGTTLLPFRQGTFFTAYAKDAEILEEGNYDHFHWKVTADGQLIISPMEGYSEAEISDFFIRKENPDPLDIYDHWMEILTPQPWHKYGRDITSVVIEEGITRIGAYAFDSITLTSVSMADSVVGIGKKAFYSPPLIKSIKWSQGLKYIGEYAFHGLKFKKLDLPESLISIGDSAFINCTELSSLTLPQNLALIGDSAFRNCEKLSSLKLPDSLESIGEYAFSGCSSLSEVDLPDNLETLSKGSFYGCKGLTSINFGKGITEIPWDCFSECSSLKSVAVDGNISTVGATSFSHCSSLAYAYIGKNVKMINHGAFCACPNLEKIIIVNPDIELNYPDPIDRTNCTIYAAASSEAQDYAIGYIEKSPFEVYGDVNLDGNFNIADLLTLQKWLTNGTSVKLKSWQHGDFSMDGSLDVIDMCMMKRKLIDSKKGKISSTDKS